MFPQSIKDWYARNTVSTVLAAMAVIIYVAAMNRDASLPWFIGALVIATIVTGFAWPRWLVHRLEVRRMGPERAQEGETVKFVLSVTNRGFWPRFLIELGDQLPFIQANQSERGGTQLGVLTYIPGGKTVTFPVPVLCERRGLHQIGPVNLASSFPLGLIEIRKPSDEPARTITIYPSLFPILHLPLSGSPRQINRGDYRLTSSSGATEFVSLREYRPGDSPKHIHWPTSARKNELIVREFEPVASATLCIALDLASSSNVGAGRESTFEYAIRIAASVARFCLTRGIKHRLVAHGKEDLSIDSDVGEHHFHRQIDALAVADSNSSLSYENVIERTVTLCPSGETLVVFLSLTELQNNLALAMLAEARAKKMHVLAIVFDQATFVDPKSATKERSSDPLGTIAALSDLDAAFVLVRKGCDLSRLFSA